MENWSVDQVCNWLRQRNLGELVPKFRAAEEEISGAALLALNDRMVQQLVKKIGHQAVLMDLINKYQQQKSVLESLTYCCETAYPKFPEVISGDTDRKMLNYSGPVEQKKCLCSNESEGGPFDPRVHKRKKNLKSVMARYKMLQWSSSYALPDFPYDIKCILAEKKCPDHSMRIRIIEFLQADMTKYLEGSLYPNSQQYNTAVSTLLQAYPFLNEDGNSFLLWKRALKDRFKYVRRPIEDDEQVLRNKWKFGHRRGQTRKSSFAENKTDDVQMQGKEAITSLITLSNSSLEKTVACRDKLPVMFWDILRARDDDCCSACPSPVTCQQVSRTELTTWKLHQLKQYLLDKGDGDNKEKLVHLEGSAMDVHIKWLKQKYMKTQEELERAFQGVLVSHTDGHL